jgi:sugar porter (SP) family MFS transporter
MNVRGYRILQIACITAPAFILFGYHQAGLSALFSLHSWVEQFPQIDTVRTHGHQKAVNSTRQGVVNSSFQIGALFGALSCSLVGEGVSRRKPIFAAGILTLIGQVLQCSAFSLPQFIVGRILLGFGIGQMNVSIPVWQSESSPARNRGQQVVTMGMFICVGFVLTSWINFGFSTLSSSNTQWRAPLGIPLVLSVVICLTVFGIPESPRWLVRVNRIEEAIFSLAKLRGLSPDDPLIQLEIEAIGTSIEDARGSSLLDIFKSDDDTRLRYRFIICLTLNFFQQMCGGNLISIYTTTIFRDNLHFADRLARIMAAVSLTWKFLASFIGYAAIDRLGRRVVIIVSGMGMMFSLVAMAIATSRPPQDNSASVAAGVFIFVFNLFYPFGFLGPNYLYVTEVAPVRLRLAMTSISVGMHWLLNFVVALVSPVALETIGWKYYFVFASVSAFIFPVVYFFFPETMNRSLEAIDSVFKDADTIWEIVPLSRKLRQGDIAVVADLSGYEREKDGVAAEYHEYVC